MKNPLSPAAALGLALASTLHGQATDGVGEGKNGENEAAAVIEAAAKSGSQITAGGADNLRVVPERLARMAERASKLRASKVEYHEGLASGEILPFPEFREKLPEIRNDVARISTSLAELRKMDADDPKIAEASKHLFGALQMVGPYLDDADYAPTPRPLSDDQLAEFEKFEESDNGPGLEGGRIELLGPSQLYTIIDLSVPIVVRGEPGSKVALVTGGGGSFENGLQVFSVEVGEDGLARASWLSRGEAVAEVEITITSPVARNTETLFIDVVKLVPRIPIALSALEGLSPTPAPAITAPSDKDLPDPAASEREVPAIPEQ